MTLNKPKVNTNQNLIPNQFVYKYLYQKTVAPALIVLITIAFLSIALFYGVQKVTEIFDDKTFEYSAQDLTSMNATNSSLLKDKEAIRDSLQVQYDNYYIDNPIKVDVDDSILVTLQKDIVRLEQTLRDLENAGNNSTPVDVKKKYHIEDLLVHIDKIRTDEIVIISIEDARTTSTSGSSHLVYQDDIGNVSFSLHGMATSSEDLSLFMLQLNEFELVSDTKIVAVETQTMSSGQRLFVFELKITPKV